LRRAMSKKIPEEMEAMRQGFIEGAKRNRIKPELAQKIFDLIAPFAGYGFNKSHSAGYAYLSYLTAYLKANYPLQFLTAAMTCEITDQDKINKFVEEARRMGIKVLPPDINKSKENFTIEEDKIRFGLAGIKNVGLLLCSKIVEERERQGEFKSIFEFLCRTRTFANRKAYESLIKAGAFDSLNPNRKLLLASLDQELAMASSERLRFQTRQVSLFSQLPEIKADRPPKDEQIVGPSEANTNELLQYELDAFGFHFSCHPLESYRPEYENLVTHNSSNLNLLDDGAQVFIGGVITNRKLKRDKRGKEYAVITLKDFNGMIEVMVFNQLFQETKALLKLHECVLIKGQVRTRDDGTHQIFADSVTPFSQVSPRPRHLKIKIPTTYLDDELLEKIKEELENYPGKSEVYLEWREDNGLSKLLRLKAPQVTVTAPLIRRLKELLGPDSIFLLESAPGN